MLLATSTDHGHNLQTVQLLIKKNQVTHALRLFFGFKSSRKLERVGERGTV